MIQFYIENLSKLEAMPDPIPGAIPDDQTGQPINPPEGEASLTHGPLRFRPFEPDWQVQPNSEAAEAEIAANFENATSLQKLNSAVADATVYGVCLRIAMNIKLNEKGFAKIRKFEEPAISALELFDETEAEESILAGMPTEQNATGYHYHSPDTEQRTEVHAILASPFLDKVAEAKRLKWDQKAVAEMALSGSGLTEVAELKNVKGVFQYDTTYLIILDDETWERVNATDNRGKNNKMGAFASPKSGYIFAPESLARGNPNMFLGALMHEYSHVIDFALAKVIQWGRKANYGGIEFSMDSPDINIAFSELTSYLSGLPYNHAEAVRESGPVIMHDYIGADHILDSDEEQFFSELFLAIEKALPYIRGLMIESGFDPDNLPNFNIFVRTFLAVLPRRRAVLRMLQDLPNTGVYQKGLEGYKEKLELPEEPK